MGRFSGALAPDGSSRGHDPRGDAIARWIPELAGLPEGHWRHRPWEAPDSVLEKSGVALADWDPDVFEPAFGYAEPEGRASPRATHRAPYPSRIAPDPERLRARSQAGIAAVRAAQLERAVERMECLDSGEGAAGPPPRDVADVLVDPRTGCDYVLVPEGATKAHAGALLPVSTRKAFKQELELLFNASHASRHSLDTLGSRHRTGAKQKRNPAAISPAPPGVFSRETGAFFPLSEIGDWAARRLNVGTTAAAIDRRTRRRRAVRRRDRRARAVRRREEAQRRAPSLGEPRTRTRTRTASVTHSHSHGGHSHLPGDKIGANHIGHTHGGGDWGAGVSARKKNLAESRAAGKEREEEKREGPEEQLGGRRARQFRRAARGAAAKDAERRAVKAGRREARELAAWSSGMRVGDVSKGGEEEDDGY